MPCDKDVCRSDGEDVTKDVPLKKGGEDGRVKAMKKKEARDFRRRYFDYYDDVKTCIKEDW